jgi:phage terminase large subunit-like protein
VEVSTAGNNPDSYGRERYEYAKQVEKDGTDERTFVAIYEAPQDLTEADLDADPVRYGKMANPTWGRIVKPGEFVSEYHAAKKSPADLADFMMYRLGVWQAAASPWLRESDWAACRREFAEADRRAATAGPAWTCPRRGT